VYYHSDRAINRPTDGYDDQFNLILQHSKLFADTSRFGGESCNLTRDFRQFFDSYYYNCFTYRAPTHTGHHASGPINQGSSYTDSSDLPDGYSPENVDSNLAQGIENGWSTIILSGSSMLDRSEGKIRVIPGTHEYLSPMSSSEGVRVIIHPPDTVPYPHTEGFDVPPGFSATFGIKVLAPRTLSLLASHNSMAY